MTRISVVQTMLLAIVISTPAVGQSTLMPSYSVPYRGFVENEKGISISFPGGASGIEGLYGVGRGAFDVRFRGGVLLGSGSDDVRVMFGAEFRSRVITQTPDFPFDGAIIFGGGVQLGDFNTISLPIGLSLGRRVELEDSDVVIVPFVQPTGIVLAGDLSDFFFSMGFGADFRLTPGFDLRLSLGLGDIDGVSISAVWIQ